VEARKSLKETRASIAGLRESINIDISARLHSLADRNHAGPPFISVHVEADAPPRASADARWHLSRIAEEAVANASKHAAASQIRVELSVLDQTLRLRVHDDGTGFDPAQIQSPGYGLPGMKERTEQLQGTFTIVSAPGQGTEICAEVPA
jgi:signal transduction histidine kinase